MLSGLCGLHYVGGYTWPFNIDSTRITGYLGALSQLFVVVIRYIVLWEL